MKTFHDFWRNIAFYCVVCYNENDNYTDRFNHIQKDRTGANVILSKTYLRRE